MKHGALALFLALSSSSNAWADPPPIPMNVEVGHERTLPPKNVRSFSVGAPNVAVHIDKGLIVLEGKQPGTASVLLILSDGTNVRYAVTVTPKR